jgi:hypothetical protein
MTKHVFEWAATQLAEYRTTETFDEAETRAACTFLVDLFHHFGRRFDADRFQLAVADRIAAGLQRKAARRHSVECNDVNDASPTERCVCAVAS